MTDIPFVCMTENVKMSPSLSVRDRHVKTCWQVEIHVSSSRVIDRWKPAGKHTGIVGAWTALWRAVSRFITRETRCMVQCELHQVSGIIFNTCLDETTTGNVSAVSVWLRCPNVCQTLCHLNPVFQSTVTQSSAAYLSLCHTVLKEIRLCVEMPFCHVMHQ